MQATVSNSCEWEDGSVGKVLVVQVGESGSDLQHPHKSGMK